MNRNETSRRHFLRTAAVAMGTASLLGVPSFQPKAVAADKKVDPFRYGGVIAVTVTPYHEDGSIDPVAMESLCRHIAGKKVNGVFIAGSTGDMPYLNQKERQTIIAAARKGIGPEKKLFAGITACSFNEMADNCRKFADVGADVGVLMTPLMFFSLSQSEIIRYYETVADRSPLPIFIYHHVKALTAIEPETVSILADHPNIIGMKETGPSMERTADLFQRIKNKKFILLQGNEPYVVDSFKMGLHGTMSALAGVIPEALVELWSAKKANDSSLFEKKAARLTELCQVFFMMPRGKSFTQFTWTLKRMLQYRGWLDNTNVRLAGFEKDEKYIGELLAFLKKVNFPTA